MNIFVSSFKVPPCIGQLSVYTSIPVDRFSESLEYKISELDETQTLFNEFPV